MKNYFTFLLALLVLCPPLMAGENSSSLPIQLAVANSQPAEAHQKKAEKLGFKDRRLFKKLKKAWQDLRTSEDPQVEKAFKFALWGLILGLGLSVVGWVFLVIAILAGAGGSAGALTGALILAVLLLVAAGIASLVGLIGGIMGLIAHKRLQEEGGAPEDIKRAKNAAILGLLPTALSIVSSFVTRIVNID
jgi:hypothetical protein